MNTPSNAIPGFPAGSQTAAPATISAMRPFYWSIRRELWEYRVLYLVPLSAAALSVPAIVIHTIVERYRMHGVLPADAAQRFLPHQHFEISAALIMGTALLVGLYYALDALYGERRDRSILFWKSLPVSDRTAVLSKLTIPLVIVPVLSFVITVAAQLLILLLSSAVLLGSGVSLSELWSHSSPFYSALLWFYHLLLVHGLWYAPIYGWLLLISAWSPRAPLVWAVLPPFVICGVEKLAFNTTYALAWVQERFLGPQSHSGMAGNAPKDLAAELIPQHFFSEPGLWIGIAIAALFLAGAIRLRRYRGPI
jgi:ABC-2 type transport system permease protein